MRTKNGFIITLVIFALLVVSSFTVTISAYRSKRTEESFIVEKEVWDGQAWVDEIDASPGDTVKFRITVTYYNITDPQNPHHATFIYVYDILPDCFEYVPGSSDPIEPYEYGNTLIYNFYYTILDHGESIVITFEASIPEEGCTGTQINEAEAEGYEICTGIDLFDEDTATVNVLSEEPEIDVEKNVSLDGCNWFDEVYAYYCTDVKFKIVVENAGDVNLSVYVNDTLPDGLDYNNSAKVNGIPQEPTFDGDIFYWFFNIIEADEIIVIQFNAHVIGEPCVEYVNWVEVTGETEGGQVVEDEDSASVFINGICIEKKVWDGQDWVEEIIAGIGEIVTFKITLCYYGNYTLYDIKVRDELPDCLNYANNAIPEEPDISGDGRTLWWNLSEEYNLEDGECLSIEFDSEVVCYECENLENLANVTASECSGDTLYDEDTAKVNIECPLAADAGGPYSGEVNEEIQIQGSASGGTPPYDYNWDLDDDGVYDDASGKIITYSWTNPGVFTIWLKVTDEKDNEATDYATVDINLDNLPPSNPKISGLTNGNPGNEYDYEFKSIDPDGDDVYYWIDWDDGTSTEWIGPYPSDNPQNISHIWNSSGTYTIRAKAKDFRGAESDWAFLTVTMPRNKVVNLIFLHFIEKIFNKFLNVFPMLYIFLQRLGLC